MQKILTFTKKAAAISPNESVKISRLKNACLNSGQPGELTTRKATPPKKTTELRIAIATVRLPLAPALPPLRIFELRSSARRWP
jgi:hypothetical protein